MESQKENLFPCYTNVVTPNDTKQVQGDPRLYKVITSGPLGAWVPASTHRMASPMPKKSRREQGVVTGARMRCRHALNLNDNTSLALGRDSGSEGETDGENDGESDCDIDGYVRDQEDVAGEEDIENDVWTAFCRRESERNKYAKWQRSVGFNDVKVEGESNEEEESFLDVENKRDPRSSGEPAVNMDFSWSEDFTSFTGQKETYSRLPGPTLDSYNPTDIFCLIWNVSFMEMVVKETNEYAWQLISKLSDPDCGARISTYLDAWTETSVEELYRYFAVLIYTSTYERSKLHEYWDTGLMGMPVFREIISWNRFQLLTKFLHFVNNDNLISSGYDRKISKVRPVVDHCNERFAELYTPSQHLSLNESVLLWKGRSSWRQYLRSKAARFGIKSLELCEAASGYLLQYKLYTGKETGMDTGPLHGFKDKTSKVVLQLVERYLDAGHVLVMDPWYNQLPLTRYLKSRRTDVLGTINHRQPYIPHAIKDLKPKELKCGESVARYSGDIALVAWQDVNLVTVVSTYHQHEMVPGTREGEASLKQMVVEEYNRCMGSLDRKDKKLSMFLIEQERNLKCYMKVFRRLFNISLLNAYIINLRNPVSRVYSHRQFRLKVAEGLLNRNFRVSSVPPSVPNRAQGLARLNPGNHFPIYTDCVEKQGGRQHKQLRCVRCTAQNKRAMVTIRCSLCQVPLCIGKCWVEYHTLEKL